MTISKLSTALGAPAGAAAAIEAKPKRTRKKAD